jgi:hypothetical protein
MMKTFTKALVLLALFALALCAQGIAQTPAAAPVPTSVPSNAADFLASLSGGQSNAPSDLPPAPTFLATVCTSSAQCPTGQLCCYPCGIDGCNRVCMTPMRGHCPFFP